jgi:hypothetical protein
MMRVKNPSLVTCLNITKKKYMSHKSASNEFFVFHHRIMEINQKKNAFFISRWRTVSSVMTLVVCFLLKSIKNCVLSSFILMNQFWMFLHIPIHPHHVFGYLKFMARFFSFHVLEKGEFLIFFREVD